jgi:hypothetical protein
LYFRLLFFFSLEALLWNIALTASPCFLYSSITFLFPLNILPPIAFYEMHFLPRFHVPVFLSFFTLCHCHVCITDSRKILKLSYKFLVTVLCAQIPASVVTFLSSLA